MPPLSFQGAGRWKTLGTRLVVIRLTLVWHHGCTMFCWLKTIVYDLDRAFRQTTSNKSFNKMNEWHRRVGLGAGHGVLLIKPDCFATMKKKQVWTVQLKYVYINKMSECWIRRSLNPEESAGNLPSRCLCLNNYMKGKRVNNRIAFVAWRFKQFFKAIWVLSCLSLRLLAALALVYRTLLLSQHARMA